MKLTTSYLFTLLAQSAVSYSYHPDLLDYPLKIIEYLANKHTGTFNNVFFDVSPHQPFLNSILEALLQTPRLQYVPKYVVQGSYRSNQIPKNPSVVLLEPGQEADLRSHQTKENIMQCLLQFHPATKVLVFLDFSNLYTSAVMRLLMVAVKCNNVMFFDTKSLRIRLGSLKDLVEVANFLPHPKYVFEWFEEELRGGNITFVTQFEPNPFDPEYKWFITTAQFLAKAAISLNGLESTEPDINLRSDVVIDFKDDFRRFFMYDPVVESILVPRGVLLNAFQIMLKPFQWQVWTLLITVLVLAEVVKRMAPDLFQNDPIMLVVCGFERYNLHQANRWERIILHSLIILMFFVTNAFETKIISLMVGKPSVPPAQSLADFDKLGLTFRFNLEENPTPSNHPVIGKYVIHDPNVNAIHYNEPDIAYYVDQDLASLNPKLSYSFERDTSWLVELKEKFMVHPAKFYYVALRCQLLEAFAFTHVTLREAGIVDLWYSQYGRYALSLIWGPRPRGNAAARAFLTFDDMLLAWIALVIGFGISLTGFIVEIAYKRIKTLLGSTRYLI